MYNNQETLFALIRAGLWGDQRSVHGEGFMVNDSLFHDVDWQRVYQLAREQSIQGLALQGIDAVQGSWFKVHGSPLVPQVLLLQWIGEVQMMEQRNKEMNAFVAELIEKLRNEDIYAILVKGQGVAQCYEKPLWRTCGDIDFLLSFDNYCKAKEYLTKNASHVDEEREDSLHLGMTIDSWIVELHGSLRCGLSRRIDRGLDELQQSIFFGGNVRSWTNGRTQVFLPRADEDIIYVFTHILEHFYKGGIGLRQICDWCRLLWTYRNSLDVCLLESRIRKMGLMSEWKAFGALAIDYLGMPAEALPLYSSEKKWSRKGDKICAFVLEVGNFGHNRDNSYHAKHPFLIRKIYSFCRRCGDLFRHARIFPLDSLRFFPYMMMNGIKAALNGVQND